MDRNEFIADLPETVRELLLHSDVALRRGDRDGALASARQALREAPDHPEGLRVLAAALSAHGPSAEAIAAIEEALVFRPDDPVTLTTHAIVMQTNGRADQAIESFRLASELAPESANNAYNLGRALYRHGDEVESLNALERALAIDLGHRNARATAAEVLIRLGRGDEAVAHLRQLLERNPADVRAWIVLATRCTTSATIDDLTAMTALLDNPATDADGRAQLGFALGKLCAERGQYPQSFAAYTKCNALVRARVPWNAQGHGKAVGELLDAFTGPVAATDAFGSEMIFIVSLPRSGSTLTEQILAAHRHVDAGEERNDVFAVIEGESRRRRQPLAQWAKLATTDDWRRLGEDYLARARRWRSNGTHATDKLPSNWLWLGAIAAMLPGARIIDCRRDRLETSWSCFCHLFRIGTQDFSYDFASIAAFARDYDRAMARWSAAYPERIRTQSYEALVADPESQIRALLAFCGLPFEAACLEFHKTERRVSTPSAAQVREPMRKDTARADKYGALLDPLRKELGLPPFAAK